ncbi:DnaJ domain-containing protein [Pontibacter sp. G13]|uniref:DnaJ domain-containing protein n=1 Tax=Pontibacter sp. G13 TaxID=3074898 RepID=UPI00288A6976|nr:DnaJ domain-containing protein [Pontibacter sp. G13]WNJ17465.1 DnaJ domain-containing protein [Pontibacter sp. G13]
MVKDYYQILEIDANASDADIKSAYRKLAMEFHPDSNDSPGAHQRFLEINEAYQILGDPQKKGLYDIKLRRIQRGEFVMEGPPPPPPTPEGRTTPPPEYYEKKAREAQARYHEFARFNLFSRTMSVIALIFGLLIVSDYLRQGDSPVAEIESIRILAKDGQTPECLIRTSQYDLRLGKDVCQFVGKGDYISMTRTPLFGIELKLSIWKPSFSDPTLLTKRYLETLLASEPSEVVEPSANVFNRYWIFLIMLFGVSIAGLVIRNQPELVFKLGLLNIVSILFNFLVVVVI